MPTQTKSESKVPARVAVEQQDPNAQGKQARQRQQQQARDQEKAQREQLKAGKASGSERTSARAFADASPAEQRHRKRGVGPLNGVVDNMTARSGEDAIEGGLVHIDVNYKGVKESLKAQLGDHVNPGPAEASFGAYISAGEVDADTGYPITAQVFLRDEHAAIVTVPYESLSRADLGGRR